VLVAPPSVSGCLLRWRCSLFRWGGLRRALPLRVFLPTHPRTVHALVSFRTHRHRRWTTHRLRRVLRREPSPQEKSPQRYVIPGCSCACVCAGGVVFLRLFLFSYALLCMPPRFLATGFSLSLSVAHSLALFCRNSLIRWRACSTSCSRSAHWSPICCCGFSSTRS
jgi:hypothetical protein